MNDYLNISEDELNLIDAYLDGKMTKKEMEAFDENLSTNKNLKSKVEEVKKLRLGIESSVLKMNMDDFHKELEEKFEKKEKTKELSFKWYHVFAAALFVIAAGAYWFAGNSNDQLFDTYFTPDPGLPTVMGDNQDDTYEFNLGMVDYKRGNYDKAIAIWELLKSNKKQNDTLDYFLGVAHLANGNVDKAIDLLNDVCNKEGFILSEDCEYYLGLAYLKTGDVESAKDNFEKSGSKKSKELMSEIN